MLGYFSGVNEVFIMNLRYMKNLYLSPFIMAKLQYVYETSTEAFEFKYPRFQSKF